MSTSVTRLAPEPSRLEHAKGADRRAEYSASTKRALVDVAQDLFTEHGYAGTSLDAIVAGAHVTKGALYHHFAGKQALFEAVFERVEHEASKAVHDRITGERDPWHKARAGLRAFLEVGPRADVPPRRHPGRAGGPGLRAVPRAGGALDVLQRAGRSSQPC